MSAVWDYTELNFSRHVSRGDIKSHLTMLAEIERWEVDRVRVFSDGRRWVRLRRKIYHLQRTA
ncbi:MAG: hypothetical protein EBS36_01420 [Actinobacteria bacterium]|nr:hypothetical protein [Actinomycetota bacterium]NBY14768.1 hypothetical protein [Actinomycetota bacterium]